MKIEYLFSRNEKIGSKLIRWASSKEELGLRKEDIPSHVAVLMNDKFVIESTMFTGVRMIPYEKWKQKNIEIFKIPCEQGDKPSGDVFHVLAKVWGKPYDWNGIAYFAVAFLNMILRGVELPKTNPWQKRKKFFCTELAGRISGVSYEMTSPAMMCAKILGKL